MTMPAPGCTAGSSFPLFQTDIPIAGYHYSAGCWLRQVLASISLSSCSVPPARGAFLFPGTARTNGQTVRRREIFRRFRRFRHPNEEIPH